MNSCLTRCALLAAASTLSLASQAAQVTIDGWTFGSGNSVHLSSSVGSYSGQAGGFRGSLLGAGTIDTATLRTYCVELTESFSHWGAPSMVGYSYVDSAAYGQWTHAASTADAIGRLMTYVSHTPTAVDTAAESTSLQLAIWNLIYDTDFSVSTGAGFRDTSAYAAYADTLLSHVAATSSEYQVGVLTMRGSQDFLMLTPLGGTDRVDLTVPEPGSAALAGLALLGAFGAAARRRRR